MTRVLAVDLGASAVRVAAVDLSARPPTVEVIHRHAHQPMSLPDGSLRWDWGALLRAIEQGLDAGLATGPVASIGVDAWGVDYGLLDHGGRLLSAPHSYRSPRTVWWREVAARLGEARLYATTGIQLMGINTLFQLAAHDRRELDAAAHLLMLPELVVNALVGGVHGERTSAATSGLVDATRGGWSRDLVAEIGVDPAILPPIEPVGTLTGRWRGVPVHLVGGHDTASAVAALPFTRARRTAFVSSGTWMLVGAERDRPDTSDAARQANFSNEPGVCGGVRFLKNVMGLWMLERCRARWGLSPGEVVEAAERAGPGGPVVDAADERFLAPRDMEAEVRAAAGLPAGAGRGRVARCVLDSLAVAVARVVAELGEFLGGPVDEVCVLGGGTRNRLLNRLIAQACGLPVRTGPQEATALGNALVQGVALGVFADLADARAGLAAGGGPARAGRTPGKASR